MSRIQDLLNRAEQEKELLRVVDLERESMSLPLAVGAGAQTATARMHQQPTSAPLTLDELLVLCPQRRWNFNPASMLFHDPKQNHRAAEEFRGIRSRLYRLRETKPLKTLLVTSSVAREGKSFVASNLAHALSIQPNCRVLLIDANLRNPGLHLFFGTTPTPGLADYLINQLEPAAVLQRGESENLFLLPAGGAFTGPAELISTGQLTPLLRLLEPAFDWILVDSPPALPFSDAAQLAHHCDAVLLVVRSDSTPLEIARQARRRFREGHLAGVVLNGAAMHPNFPEIH
jgi:protein-tyrosine kinase